MPTDFSSLPRELRDAIYAATLDANPSDPWAYAAEQSPNHWFPGRNTTPGFHRPLVHYHKAIVQGADEDYPDGHSWSTWEHETRIWRGGEGWYFRTRILLELTLADDCEVRLDEWEKGLRDADVAAIQVLHISVFANAILRVGDDTDFTQPIVKAYMHKQLEFAAPLFRLALCDQGRSMSLHSKIKLDDEVNKEMDHLLQTFIDTNYKDGVRFEGVDLLKVARLLPKVTDMPYKEGSLDGFVELEDVEEIVEQDDASRDESLGNAQPEVRLRGGYAYLVADLTVGKTTEKA